jgi:hypothetical protein
MGVASVEQQDGTINLGADRREIPRRANLLDMLGRSHDLSPATLGPDKFSPPEEDSCSKTTVCLGAYPQTGKAHEHTESA